jgi:hypothetical protein
MPFDPFFTSAVKDEAHERKQAQQAFAKAVQMRFIHPSKSKRGVILRRSPERRRAYLVETHIK